MNSVNLDKYSDPFFLGETKEELRRIRQDFHVHPEIGLVTPRTSRIIADLLKDYGVDEVHEGVGGDGVVGVIYGKLPGEAPNAGALFVARPRCLARGRGRGVYFLSSSTTV